MLRSKFCLPQWATDYALDTSYSGLIILGGPMSAEDDANYPHLMDVVRLVQLFSARK